MRQVNWWPGGLILPGSLEDSSTANDPLRAMVRATLAKLGLQPAD